MTLTVLRQTGISLAQTHVHAICSYLTITISYQCPTVLIVWIVYAKVSVSAEYKSELDALIEVAGPSRAFMHYIKMASCTENGPAIIQVIRKPNSTHHPSNAEEISFRVRYRPRVASLKSLDDPPLESSGAGFCQPQINPKNKTCIPCACEFGRTQDGLARQ